jgi:superfamily I DNA and/or RNA helicase
MHLPLRQLLQEIPSVVLRLTPCLLMSPLSIAQYLSADTANFDLVVFDEASQIPVWDAIGAMARGKQVVMVGDPKQLPPTNFFSRGDADDDDDVSEGDLESILDECLGASLPTRNLSWHYRSRHESLIAFSNHRYYAGGLVTFPSPLTEDRAVSFHLVKGRYEKGGARINKPEAQALVADLVGRLKSPGFRQSGLTIGVVTFNSEQQSLIEDLLDDERRMDPELEHYFAEEQLEPVFVKNLESVQGDERDIMYFSITYGPDIAGAVSMNFGPLNRDGGERRLNVAVTRARHELRVFSSLCGEQMDLSRTKAAGVRDLKHFLGQR